MRNQQKKNENFNFLLSQVLNPKDSLHFNNNPFSVGPATEARCNTEMTRLEQDERPNKSYDHFIPTTYLPEKLYTHSHHSSLFRRRLPTLLNITSHTNCPPSSSNVYRVFIHFACRHVTSATSCPTSRRSVLLLLLACCKKSKC